MTTLEQPNYYNNDVYLEIDNSIVELDNMYCGNELIKYSENIDMCSDESYIEYYKQLISDKQNKSFTEASKDISISPIFPDLPLLSSDFPEIVFDKSSFIPIKTRSQSKMILKSVEDISEDVKPIKVGKKIGKKVGKKVGKKGYKKVGKKGYKKLKIIPK